MDEKEKKNAIEPSGILLLRKPSGCTSHDMVGKVRKLYGTRRVGHTGTLDPMAEGLLVMLVGRAAKASEYVSHDRKNYEAVLRLGLTTDTEDITGEALSVSDPDKIPTGREVLAALENFRGEINQVPPMYSAKKVDGRKLCDVARKGGEIERKPVPVHVFGLTAEPIVTEEKTSSTDYRLSVCCSGGTYIRTLCADIGKTLGCGGVMAALLRTSCGGFSLCDAHTVEEIEAMGEEERLSLLLPVESLFGDCDEWVLPPFYEKLFYSGCEIYLTKIGKDADAFPVGTRVRMKRADGKFYALGEVMAFENGPAVKSVKIFLLKEEKEEE